MGAFCSAGNDVPSLWESVREGRSPATWVYKTLTGKSRHIAGCRITKLPPTINYCNPDPSIPLDVISEGAREKEAQYVMSNSLGFWGNCASLIFSKT